MKRGVKSAAKATPPRQGPHIKGQGSADEAAWVEVQKAWAYTVAEGIERGDLPKASNERRRIAAILREAADRLRAAPRGKGNPNFEHKLPDHYSVALVVGMRIARHDEEPNAAIAHVADSFDVDESTIRKIFRAHREAVAVWVSENPNFAHRCGVIRGE